EVFQEEEDLSEAQRHARFRGIRGEFRNTMVLETGMNPGLISLLCKRGMRDAGIKSEDVHTIHVTEYDTHVMRPEHREQDAFYNTW
ncbi:hypothetical protein J0680_24550, partial [Vibrio parahaemolyticus]|uniref:hypothetical protein n=1 Tax=Vibrio parahaemolyticus TaxID=670 RepID=UPI001A8F7692